MSINTLERKRLSVEDMKPSKYTRTIVSDWENGKEYYSRDNLASLLLAFKDWAYICASKNASCFAKIPFKLFVAKKAGSRMLVPTRNVDRVTLKWLNTQTGFERFVTKASEIKEVIDHPFLDIMKGVNPFMEGYSLLEITDLFLELTGNAYWYIVRNKLGVPSQIWYIPPQFMYVIPSKEKFIAGYMYRRGTDVVPFDLHEIVHFKFPNPHNLYYGMSPLAAIVNELNIKENMDKFENSLFFNNCRPEGVLETDMALDEVTFERTKEQWKQNYSGVNKVGKTAVLEKGLKYHAITFPPRELTFLSGRQEHMKIVAGVFGVPLSKLTTDSVNLANAYVGERQYYSDTILTRCKRFEEGINGRVMSMFDDSIFMAFNNPVPDDKEFMLRQRVLDLKSFYRTINEYRKEDGLEPVSWGDKPYESSKAGEGGQVSNDNASGDDKI